MLFLKAEQVILSLKLSQALLYLKARENDFRASLADMVLLS